jgi:hypothetical protein
MVTIRGFMHRTKKMLGLSLTATTAAQLEIADLVLGTLQQNVQHHPAPRL